MGTYTLRCPLRAHNVVLDGRIVLDLPYVANEDRPAVAQAMGTAAMSSAVGRVLIASI